MTAIRFTERARRELRELDVSDPYADAIELAIERCALVRGVGTQVPDRPSVRRMLCGQHFVYVRHEADSVVILRITHTRRKQGHL